jgi:hypothetical protein
MIKSTPAACLPVRDAPKKHKGIIRPAAITTQSQYNAFIRTCEGFVSALAIFSQMKLLINAKVRPMGRNSRLDWTSLETLMNDEVEYSKKPIKN